MRDTPRDEIARLQAEYEKNPEGRLFVHLAEAYRRSGELEKAREILREGLTRHSDYLSARIVLAQVETELGSTGTAAEVWREVIKLDPDNELALWALAELEYNGGRPSQSLVYYKRLAELGVDDAELDEMIALLQANGSEGGASDMAEAPLTGAAVEAASASLKGNMGKAEENVPAGRSAAPESVATPQPAPAEPVAQTTTPPSGAASAAGESQSARESAPRQEVRGGEAGFVGSAGAESSQASSGVRSDSSRNASSARPAASSEQIRRRGSNGSTALAHTDAIGLSDLLIRLLEYRDATFHAGSSLTRLLAISIGRELELDQIHIEALALAALLSDLGGLGLSSGNGRRLDDLQDPNERRQAEQREVAISLQLLHDITLPAGVHEAVRHQHERWDGKGYPDGLREEEIPYGARVITIARACASHLSEGISSRSIASALDELQRNAGSRYDPVVVSVLRRVFQRRADHGIGFGLGGRIVVAHPDELRGLSVATHLHSEGYVSEVARELGRARDSIRKITPKSVVLGASLPGDDLARFIREIRGNAELAGIPLVVIDANDLDTRVELLTSGADVCLPGDVSFREFKATLGALLRRREEIDAPVADRLARF